MMHPARGLLFAIMVLVALSLASGSNHAKAATINVPCSTPDLIAAIETANGNGVPDTLELSTACSYVLLAPYSGGENGLPAISSEITINGNGANISRDGSAGQFRILEVTSAGSLTLNNATVSGGRAPDGGPGLAGKNGGGISSTQGGTLTIMNSTISNNRAGDGGDNPGGTGGSGGLGGGIFALQGSLSITNSTVHGNTAGDAGITSPSSGALAGEGGGVYVQLSTGHFSNSTFYGNTSGFGQNTSPLQGFGGGIYHATQSINLTNVTIMGNTASFAGGILNGYNNVIRAKNSLIIGNVGGNCGGGNFSPSPFSFNNMKDDASFSCDSGFTQKTTGEINAGLLGLNGGPTQTVPLIHPSTAIDAGDSTTCASAPVNNLDQRGSIRPVDGDNSGSATCDIGAYEAGCPTADADSDGMCDGWDNCPSWPNASQAQPDWPIPAGDSDCDGYSDSVGQTILAPETYIGTDPTRQCAANTGTNNETGMDAWPMDFNDNRLANGSDFLTFIYSINQSTSGPPITIPGGVGTFERTRWDFSGNGLINGQDFLKFINFIGKSCSP